MLQINSQKKVSLNFLLLNAKQNDEKAEKQKAETRKVRLGKVLYKLNISTEERKGCSKERDRERHNKKVVTKIETISTLYLCCCCVHLQQQN